MSAWLQPKIKCFYCGRSSKHRKGDKIRTFQCSDCEGTNYLDEHGNITDIPAQAVDSPSQTRKRYALPVAQRPPTSKVEDTTFCSRCIKNQRIVSDCLANYLPPESDPRYQQFVAGFDKYKQDLERRYPQVCPRCEARVRARLKKNTYVAQGDSFNRLLAKSAHLTTHGHIGSFMSLVEAAWWMNILVQGSWHLLGTIGKLDPAQPSIHAQHIQEHVKLSDCLLALRQNSVLDSSCASILNQVVRFSFYFSIILLWWTPAMTSVKARIVINKSSFYLFQVTMLFGRWLSWYCINDDAWTLGRQATRGVQLVVVVLTLFTLAATYRMVTQGPRHKFVRRDLNAPLVDEHSFQYPSDDFISRPSPPGPSKARFSISSLKTSDSTSDPSVLEPTTLSPLTPPPESDLDRASDAMDWEPIQPQNTQPTYNLRPRGVGAPLQFSQPQYPSTSAFASFPSQPGPNPFYGSLPAAPQSMEAKLRGAAQRPVPQFKPPSDAKRADWFKRMGLAQNSASWAGRDYVSRVRQKDELPELSPGKLSLDRLDGRMIEGTGLEDMFGNSFKLDDRGESPEKEATPTNGEKSASESLTILVGMCGIALLLVLLSQFAPELWHRLMHMKEQWMDRARKLAYGQGLE